MTPTGRQTGEIRKAQIFVAVLGASSFTYARATWTQTLVDWIDAQISLPSSTFAR
jgi:transposase